MIVPHAYLQSLEPYVKFSWGHMWINGTLFHLIKNQEGTFLQELGLLNNFNARASIQDLLVIVHLDIYWLYKNVGS